MHSLLRTLCLAPLQLFQEWGWRRSRAATLRELQVMLTPGLGSAGINALCNFTTARVKTRQPSGPRNHSIGKSTIEAMPYIFLWPTRLMACFISCARAFQFSHFYTFDLRALCCVLLSLSPNPTTISAARMILETQLYRELARVIQSLISAMCTCIRRRAHLRASSRPSPLLVRHLKWGPRMTSGPLEANSPSPHDLSLGRIRVTTRIRETASA